MAPPSANSEEESDEEDYMSMALPTETPQHETSIARAARLKRESAARGVHKSKAQLEAEEKQATAANLSRPIDASNKGFKMLERMGFKAGGALGRAARDKADGKDDALREPIRVKMRERRAGIGGEKDDSTKKRKRSDQNDDDEEDNKVPKQDSEEYRKQRAQDVENSRIERRIFAAQKTAIRLEEQEAERMGQNWAGRPLDQIAVVIREMVQRERAVEAERNRQREENKQAGQRVKKPIFDDSEDEDVEYRHAFGLEMQGLRKVADQTDDTEDPEIQEFNEMTPNDKLQRSVDFLRNEHLYCFWCRVKYVDHSDLAENCPGRREEDHEELDE